jgi:hypothetical protein
MEISIERKAHVFRFPAYLLEKLKEAAKKDRISLNNYVEGILLDAVYNEPNEETLQSLEDAKAGRTYGPIDTSSVENMIKSIGL